MGEGFSGDVLAKSGMSEYDEAEVCRVRVSVSGSGSIRRESMMGCECEERR